MSSRWMHRTDFAVALGAAGVAAIVLALRHAGLLMPLELAAFDHFVRATWDGPERDARVALVLVTERDIQETGEWPLSDLRLVRTLDAVQRAGARVVGVDIYRDVPVPPGHEELDERLAAASRAIFITQFASPGERGVPPPPVLAGTDQVGFNNVVLDPDGVVRRMALFMDDEHGGVGYSFPLQIALSYLADEGIQPVPDPRREDLLRLGGTTFERLDSELGGYRGIDSGGYQVPFDLRHAARGFDSLTLSELLDDPELARTTLHDRAVLVGVAAESVRDPFRIPLGPGRAGDVPGVELHAQMTAKLLRLGLGEGRPLHATRDAQEVALVLACAALGAAAGLWLRSGRLLALATGGGLVLLWAAGYRAHLAALWIPVVAPGLAWVGAVSTVTAYLSRRERRERSQLMQLFSRHVSPEIAEDVWQHRDEFLEADQRPRRQRLTATTFFADLVDFTSRTEKIDPAELMDWLEEFLAVLAKGVIARGGLVEDYFGDGMMACFGVPLPSTTPEEIARDARNAVLAALDIREAIERSNRDWRGRGLPAAHVRIGISTGDVVAGSLGASTRAKFCIVGESVVTAQRLQSLGTSRHDFETDPCRILVDEGAQARLDASFVTEPFGAFELKGKSEPVSVHRVLARQPANREVRGGV